MNRFWPHDLNTVWLVLASCIVMSLVGFGITRLGSLVLGRTACWLLLLLSIGWTCWLVDGSPPLFQMLAILIVPGPIMKALMSVETQGAGEPALRPLNWFAFEHSWVGMRPRIFANLGQPALPGASHLIWDGFRRATLGVALLAAARGLWVLAAPGWGAVNAAYVASVLAVPGLSLVFHMGASSIVAGCWRLAGVDCRSPFRTPLKARSLTDFWGSRWNLLFVEMTTLAIVRPLQKHVGKPMATAAAFLWSGLAHELVVSVPVKGGYGWVTLYFLLHFVLLHIERALEYRGLAISKAGWLSRVWTLGWFALPLVVCIPRPFLEQVIWRVFLGMEPSGVPSP